MKYSLGSHVGVDVTFKTAGAADPIGVTGPATVTRTGPGEFLVTLSGSGPLYFKSGQASVDSPDFRAALEGQSGDRGFVVKTRQSEDVIRTLTLDSAGSAILVETEEALETVARDIVVTAVSYTPTAALTADNTDFATLSLAIDDDPDVEVASITTEITGSGDWTEDVAVPLTVTAGSVPSGSALIFTVTKDGAGVVVPTGTLSVTYTVGGVVTRTQKIHLRRAADGLAADETTIGLTVLDRAAHISAIAFLPDAALTAHDTNYATVELNTDEPATVATLNTKITGGTGNWSALVAEALAIDTDEDDLVAGDVLSLAITKAAAGVVVPAGCIMLTLTESGTDTVADTISSDPLNGEFVRLHLVLAPQNI